MDLKADVRIDVKAERRPTGFFKKLTRRTEFYVFLCLVLLCIIVEVRSGQFFTANNIVDILRSMVVPGMFALIALMVIVSGGFDMSFPSLAALSYSLTTTLMVNNDFQGNIFWFFLMAAVIGAVLGILNGWIISNFKLPTMIVTLATGTVFTGIMLGVLSLKEITSTLPAQMRDFGKSYLFEVFSPTGLRSTMPTSFIFLVVLAIIVALVLKYTKFGRALYAIGGNEVSAERAGFYVKRTKFFLYIFVGALSAVTGVVRCCMAEQAVPAALTGMEMKVLPAVILGGASIFGGEGSVIGTILAIALITTMENSMLLLGINTYWKDFFTGLVILIGVSVAAIQVRRAKRL